MRFWNLFGRPAAPANPESDAPERAAVDAAPPAPDNLVQHAHIETNTRLEQLALAERPGGLPTEVAVQLLNSARNHAGEAAAVATLLPRALNAELSEALSTALASLLADRGDSEAALRVLSRARLPPGLLLCADLLERRGELALALTKVERALLVDWDHPGASERLRRMRAALGLDEHAAKRMQTTTTMAARDTGSPFRIQAEVARGGAGAVYDAEDQVLGRRVALKVYHQPERDRPQLIHEARVACALAGPGVVEVFDADAEHGWIAYEFAEAGALRGLLSRAGEPWVLPLTPWLTELASALARCHAAGWVHHDVKPANVLFGANSAVVLADFGIARRIGEPSPEGSLGYVSPERRAGRVSDPRDDVYGFGRTLEEALTAFPHARSAALIALAAACVGPDHTRPAGGRSVLRRLQVE